MAMVTHGSFLGYAVAPGLLRFALRLGIKRSSFQSPKGCGAAL
jgi:hypothetical protein